MSRWLKSVNSILEKLDDGAEFGNERLAAGASSAAALTQRLFERAAAGEEDDDEYESSEEESEEYEDEYLDSDYPMSRPESMDEYSDEEEEEEEVEEQEVPEAPPQHAPASAVEPPVAVKPSPPPPPPVQLAPVVRPSPPVASESVEKPPPLEPKAPPPLAPAPVAPAATAAPEAPRRSSAPPAPPASINSALLAQQKAMYEKRLADQQTQREAAEEQLSASLKKTLRDVKKLTADLGRAEKAQQQANVDIERLQAVNEDLEARLASTLAEMEAQQAELMQAAGIVEEERKALDEEKQELLEEQEEELAALKAEQEEQMAEQKAMYEQQLADLRQELADEQARRYQEGGDMTDELQSALARESVAVSKVSELERKQSELEGRMNQLAEEKTTLESKIVDLTSAAQTSAERERAAEERLDGAMQQHKNQLTMRQAREAELEQTVAELGAALAEAQKTSRRASAPVGEETAEASYKSQYVLVKEELETVQAKLLLTEQRCATLERDLQDTLQERNREAQASQEIQRDYDRRLSELTLHAKKVESSMRHSASNVSSEEALREALREAEDAKRHVASLSDQLMRQQGVAEAAKSEILALKGRLQTANERAEAAEQASAAGLDIEGGYSGSKTRRRIKGGRYRGQGRLGHLSTRSVRAALGLRVVSGSAMEQVALTIDAVDNWMMETGTILRHEPLARIGLAAYMLILHLWCFGLVFFHTVESEHGDLRSLTQHTPHGPSAVLGAP